MSALGCAWDVARITCKCCGDLMPLSPGRLAYVVLFSAASLASWCIGSYLPPADFRYVAAFRECPSGSRACLLTLTVSRAMLAMAAFHAIHAVAMIGVKTNSDFRHRFQDSWWPVKLAALAGLAAGAVYLPNVFYLGYQWASLSGAAVFAVVQLVVLADMASAWARRWIGKMEESESESGGACCNCWFAALVAITSAIFASAIVVNALLIAFYTQRHGPGTCAGGKLNAFFASFNIILGAGATALSVLPSVRERKTSSGVFQAAVVCAYASYVVFGAASSEPRGWTDGCNAIFALDTENSAGQKTALAMGTAFVLATVIYFATRNGDTDLAYHSGKVDAEIEAGTDVSADDSGVSYNHAAFHCVMMLACMYNEHLLANWEVVTSGPSPSAYAAPSLSPPIYDLCILMHHSLSPRLT